MNAELSRGLPMRWVGVYVSLVDAESAERRRGEIASDLWEQRTTATLEGRATRWVRLSQARRTLAGMGADIAWVHLQRAQAGRPQPRLADVARELARYAIRWSWVVGALAIAVVYLYVARMIWDEPGRPYADQLFVVLPAAALLVVGCALCARWPRAAAALVIVGTVPAFVAWWLPGLLAATTLVVIGAVVELGHYTTSGRTGRTVALSAVVVLAAAMIAPFPLGFSTWWVALAAAALVALALTVRRPAAVAGPA